MFSVVFMQFQEINILESQFQAVLMDREKRKQAPGDCLVSSGSLIMMIQVFLLFPLLST